MTESDVQLALFHRFRGGSIALVPNCYALGHEADVLRVTRNRRAHEYEIKLTVSDFRADAAKSRWSDTRWRGPNRFSYVLAADVADRVEVPPWAGLLVATPREDYWPCLSIRRQAPQRHAEAISPAALERMLLSCMYRMWSSRKLSAPPGSAPEPYPYPPEPAD